MCRLALGVGRATWISLPLTGIPQIKPTFLGDSSLWVALNYNHESQNASTAL